MSKPITYNSYNLQTATIVMTNLEFLSSEKNVNMPRISSTDINKFIESYIANKTIKYTGYIKGTSASDADDKLDELKQNVLLNQVANLDIGYGNSTRRYRAVTQSVEVIDESPALDIKQIEILFNTAEPLGLATSTHSISYTSETADPITKTVTFSGTYYALPKYTVTVSSASNMTALSIKTVETNQEVIITQNFAGNDIVIVDTREKEVKYNGTSVDYEGIFPLAQQGTNDITFNPTSSSHSLNIDIEYIPRYL
jgi:hypothetical protein